MTGKIFVHIGLPKTATTTLQVDFFPSLVNESTKYVGVIQPRDKSVQSELYTSFYDAVETGNGVGDIRRVLDDELSLGTSLIISEEVICVSTHRSSWRVKLRNLHAILENFDYLLILSVREPTAAIFSYYVELYNKFSTQSRSFLDSALNDEGMEVFHYGKLTDEIFRCFQRERVCAIRFEDIINNDLTGLARKISPDTGIKDYIIRKHNDKKQDNGVVYTGNNYTAKIMLHRIIARIGLHDSMFVKIIKILFIPFICLLDKIVVGKESIIKPSKEEMESLRVILCDETASLNAYFGINYE